MQISAAEKLRSITVGMNERNTSGEWATPLFADGCALTHMLFVISPLYKSTLSMHQRLLALQGRLMRRSPQLVVETAKLPLRDISKCGTDEMLY